MAPRTLSTSFLVSAAALLLSAASTPSLPQRAGGEELAWVRESFRTRFVSLTVSTPASLTPIEVDEGMTGGFSMKSFDGRTILSYEDQATYFETVQMPRRQFVRMTSCDPRASPRSLADAMHTVTYQGDVRVVSCISGRNKRVSVVRGAYVEDAKGDQRFDRTRLCGYVLGVAPDVRDESRFVVQFTLCSDRLDQAEVAKIVHGMFETLSFAYVGGCPRAENQIGCNWGGSE